MAGFEYSIAGVGLESPLVNAAGSVNGAYPERILREVDELSDTGIGAITVGSFTVPAQEGNAVKFGEPVYYHDPAKGETYNSMGLPNVGLEEAKKLVPQVIERAHDKGKPVIASVSSTIHTEEIGNSHKQLARLVYEMLLTGVDLVEVNTSSPNTVTADGGRKPIIGYDLETMEELVAELAPWTGTLNSKVGVKLPPYISAEDQLTVPALAKVFAAHRVFGFITTSNTIGGQVARDSSGEPILTVPNGAGGMSGPATKQTGREQLSLWREHASDDIDIVSTLAVDSGKELATRLRLGAAAAGGVTFLWESGSWKDAVTNMLVDFADA